MLYLLVCGRTSSHLGQIKMMKFQGQKQYFRGKNRASKPTALCQHPQYCEAYQHPLKILSNSEQSQLHFGRYRKQTKCPSCQRS
ncbi:hypothetical protein FGO68_gene12518 [Halteria grandinella]|uniref:Uncharacterized protein n=1 Tax=Halteria grandinella TaxID=5974 RepID=A0A8J8T5F7_HALGN|nr:hypothetical protein FGO68_gene12518 [Halteria grandinella]